MPSKELSKSEFYQHYVKKYRETLIKQLIDGSFEDKKYYVARVEAIYKGFKDYLFLAVADTSKCDAKHAKLAFCIDLFKQTQPEFKYYMHSNSIVIILSSDDATLYVEKDLYNLY